GRLPDAAALMRMALERWIALKESAIAAQGADNLSGILQDRGDLSEALVYAKQSVELASTGGYVDQCMRSRLTLATALRALGHWKAAVAQFEAAERIIAEEGAVYVEGV